MWNFKSLVKPEANLNATSEFNVGDTVQIIGTPQKVKITRIDRHVRPICAGYGRFLPNQLKLISKK